MKGKLISFRGPIGSGKTTAANILVQKYGYTKTAFGHALKSELFDVLKDSQNHESNFNLKQFEKVTSFQIKELIEEEILPNFNKFEDKEKIAWIVERNDALRPLLQWWATEYRRAHDPDYWVKRWMLTYNRLVEEGKTVTVDDTRFENEINTVLELGGIHIFLSTKNSISQERIRERAKGKNSIGLKNHQSEMNLNKEEAKNKYVIYNNGSLEDLEKTLHNIINRERTKPD